VVQNVFNNEDNQRWTISESDDDGCVTISPDFSDIRVGKYFMDIAGHESDDGAVLHIWESNGGYDNQKFKLVLKEPGYYSIESKESPHLVLDVPGRSVLF